MQNSPIGLIGVGLLGTALAERMLAGGFSVLGYDLQPPQLDRFRQLGGTPAKDVHQIAGECERIVLCLPDSLVVRSVLDGMKTTLRTGALLIDATTGEPDDTERLARQLNSQGIGYLDATIAGSSEQVRRGEAVVILGG